MTGAEWWRRGVFYQVYPRSFADTDGSGVGDIRGVIEHLDHIASLGVDAIWMSPFYESPMRDNGYDISDHCAVDPAFGTIDDFDELVATAHAAGLRLIIDFVPNHVSSDHPWFVEAVADPTSDKRDWFIWADPAADGGPPTNWTASFTEKSAWELDEASGQYYLHLFLPSQPDVDWENPGLAEAQLDVLRFWLARGVDGFRIDVVNAVGKDPDPKDVPAQLVGLPHVMLTHHETAATHIRAMRETVDTEPDRMIIGEVTTIDAAVQAGYQGDGDGLNLCVNFSSIFTPWERDPWRDLILAMEAAYPADGPRWPSYVLSNHDFPRVRTRYGDREARTRAAIVLLLGLRGTPFLYQGDELGLGDAVIASGSEVDPGGRDGCRAPIPWRAEYPHGWGATHWLPFSPLSKVRSVERQNADPLSFLRMVRIALAQRRESPALQVGRLEMLDGPDDVIAFRRYTDDDERIVAVSFADQPIAIDLEGLVVVASDGVGSLAPFEGRIVREQAVIIKP